MDLANVSLFLFIVYACMHLSYGQQILRTFTGEVGAGNFTFFKLSSEGTITLVLDSIEGDADIYAVQGSKNPDYNFYDINSCTCGRDVITVPKSFTRPVAIGIYGHVWAIAQSKYILTVYMEEDGDGEYEKYENQESMRKNGNTAEDDEESQESLLWVIFVSILKVIIEVIA